MDSKSASIIGVCLIIAALIVTLVPRWQSSSNEPKTPPEVPSIKPSPE